LDAKIREMPYRGGWQFDIEKRCLPGTRQDFLDYVTNWVENPESERALVLLGPAGTGKSSIAHEVARRFENKRLGSYSAFLRKEQSKDEAYQLFTTLARDLSDRYPAFKLALRKVIKNNPSIRRTRDYRTLFERLLLEPLKNLRLADPILVIIDALDESGDAIGKSGLQIFLSQHLFDLPAKFRVLITSRPDNGIGLAFSNALSVRTLQINDVILAAKKEQDITVYLEKELPPDVFKDHGVKLVTTADGLFQWAAVACGFINNPPVSFGFSENKCVQRLLELPRDRNGQDPLDNLYEEVLEAYFKPQEASILFRSVMGQLLVAIEPLSVRALTTLRQYTPINGPENARPVVELLRHIDSLLSNVNSSDQTCPIIPLHTSFRDFLTDKKSDAFYVDLGDAHYQLAHSCLGLMLDNLKFNICKLESSYLANADVLDLESRIAEHITPALTYACIHWHDHLQHLAFDHDILEKLRSLFETKFLFWLEVLSIKSSVGLASRALSSLSIWLRREVSTLYNRI
jgi:DNA polymerase III delta prime subunit